MSPDAEPPPDRPFRNPAPREEAQTRATANYHTHTHLCGHGEGTVYDYAVEALRKGATVLGMSDHTPLPDNRLPPLRMPLKDLDEYERQLENARKALPRLTILKGMECEIEPRYYDFYRRELKERRGFDYLVGAVHWIPFRRDYVPVEKAKTTGQIEAYAQCLIDGMASGLFDFIAHPCIYGHGFHEWTREALVVGKEILLAAERLKVPLEINATGFLHLADDTIQRKSWESPWLPFWQLAADYDIRVVCNSDAHRPQDTLVGIDACLHMAQRRHLPVYAPGACG